MNIKEKYPLVTATKLRDNFNAPEKLFLFNTVTNSGYQLDGMISLLVREFDGVKTVGEILSKLEKEYKFEKGKHDQEMELLLNDLFINGLIAFVEKESHEIE